MLGGQLEKMVVNLEVGFQSNMGLVPVSSPKSSVTLEKGLLPSVGSVSIMSSLPNGDGSTKDNKE
jgi:hypothetical protein